jgi:hypothetical protein
MYGVQYLTCYGYGVRVQVQVVQAQTVQPYSVRRTDTAAFRQWLCMLWFFWLGTGEGGQVIPTQRPRDPQTILEAGMGKEAEEIESLAGLYP